jgi:indole-3-glycerol phosphate synthase
VNAVAPLALPDVSTLEGTLGEICRDRAADYAGASLELTPRLHSRRFEQALKGDGLRLIAEVKRASPRGEINAGLGALEAAKAYTEGGASAISVLTEPKRFLGSLEDLQEVSRNVDLPTLRKDFVVHPAMMQEAAQHGASAILLLVNVLGKLTKAYLEACHHVGLDALVEVHTEEELDIALEAGSRIIGINNRDLKSLEINLGTAPRVGLLAREYDFEGVLLALSGYSNRAELISLEGTFDAVLIGSSLVGSGDIASSTRALLGR